ncbi:MAG TPA: hypothetical protein VEX40_03360 [Mycobacterium sp.]|nr:hypothetical protein [Mycobacterium sp.]
MTFMTGGAITILADDAPKLAEPVASGWQLILAFLANAGTKGARVPVPPTLTAVSPSN